MKILGIESSCDETAAAIVEDGTRLLSNVVVSQIDIHASYGGVIPEIAARSHIEAINPVIDKALQDARCSWDDIDAIGVTYAPGLIGSLLVGTLAARTLAHLKKKPLYAVQHVEGHVYANFLVDDATTAPRFPILALIVSGGHSQLVLFRNHGDYVLLGQTEDDAVGEAFDKVAKIIGLPYPGGPSVAKAAESGDPRAYIFPKAKLTCPTGCTHGQDNQKASSSALLCRRYSFSFSGVKTAVLRRVQAEVGKSYDFPSHELPGLVNDALRNDITASFQHIAVETLVEKTMLAFHDFSPASVVIAGGVAANQELRRQLKEALPIDITYAPMNLCTDNAAMIASLAYFMSKQVTPTDPLDLEVIPSISMTKTAWATHKA